MKIFLTLVLLIFLSPCVSFCQNDSSTIAERLAFKIAGKISDSLHLTSAQRDSVYNINIYLHEQKMDVRKRYTHPAMLEAAIQQIENSRDSLYRKVLVGEKFSLYRQKKRYLVNAQ